MIGLVKDGNAVSVKQDGYTCGQIEFVGEPENGSYCFIPRPKAVFRSTDLVEIARQVSFLDGETFQPVETKNHTPAEFENAEHTITGTVLKEALAEARKQGALEGTKPATTDLDTVAERILAQFKNEDDTRTDADLLAASGLNREAYLDARDFLLIETEELSETAEDTAPTEYVRNFPRSVEAAA